MKQPILIASNNQDKSQELSAISALFGLQAVNYQTVAATKFQFPEETLDYGQNAQQKAEFIWQQLQQSYPVLGDDSGIHLDFLPNRFNEATKREFAKSSQNHVTYLLQLLEEAPLERRGITMVTHLVLRNYRGIYHATGYLTGHVALQAMGTGGFDLDRIVISTGFQQTLAQLSPMVRMRLGHRYQAMTHLIQQMR
ncbi:hypothetical protein FHQ08_05000 [Lactobacillus sp. CC-MHH1034]|uniref:non-canonical purine NTP pyrophosphatase n=1 Tax=Agrilactobacillus fermenti TaxID=2586909 RepID=UPI001E502491|nr:non-canonical purine NTP pyrophosphatase [Agrilactobacillus fermenti]MCD2256072.1 hypothetical protein [Agrilactobacillus fermenti]